MGYSFMTFQKIKSPQVLMKKYKHNYRLIDVANADPRFKKYNEEIKSLYGLSYKDILDDKIVESNFYKNHKVRSNATIALEVLTTFSRNELDNIDLNLWKETNRQWLEDSFNVKGKTDNIISMMFHADEYGNVHIHSLVIPMDEKGQLNASHYIDGRQKLINLQDTYGKLMKEKHNLERGLHRTKAKHQDIKKFYTSLNQEISKKLPEIKKDESFIDYFKRIGDFYEQSNLNHLGEMNNIKRKIDEKDTFVSNLKIENNQYKKRINKIDKKLKNYNKDNTTPIDEDIIFEKAEMIDKIILGLMEDNNNDKAKQTLDNMISYLKEQLQKDYGKIENEKIKLLIDKRKQLLKSRNKKEQQFEKI